MSAPKRSRLEYCSAPGDSRIPVFHRTRIIQPGRGIPPGPANKISEVPAADSTFTLSTITKPRELDLTYTLSNLAVECTRIIEPTDASPTRSARSRLSSTFIKSSPPEELSQSDVISPDADNFIPLANSSPKSDCARVTECHVGRLVSVGGGKTGVLRYLGPLHGQEGVWCGVELEEPEGLNDGSVYGVRYFTCTPQHGILAPVSRVSPLAGVSSKRNGRRETLTIANSGPFSLLAGLPDMDKTNDTTLTQEEQLETAQVSAPTTPTPPQHLEWARAAQQLSKQSSTEQDESLGILTPDQMLDFSCIPEISNSLMTWLQTRTASSEDALPIVGDAMQVLHEAEDASTAENADEFWRKKLQEFGEDETMLDQVSFPRIESMLLDSLVEDRTPDVPPEELPSKSISETDFTPQSPRVDLSERTLSPEDLPVDTPLQDEARDIVDKQDELSEASRDITGSSSAGPSSRSSTAPLPPPPISFVTSVTSITSLDNGYQGDGEWSRPASRGADHSPTGSAPPPCPKPIPAPAIDPMTDSDFFTESDADPHEEVPAMRRGGDRRAQVIDGTLYGSTLPAHQHQRCPSFTASINEEMESSGVYSDLDKRTEEATSSDGGKTYPDEEKNPLEVDVSPDASTKTISSGSERSQMKEVNNPLRPEKDFVDNANEGVQEQSLSMTIVDNNLKNQEQPMLATLTGTSIETADSPNIKMETDVGENLPALKNAPVSAVVNNATLSAAKSPTKEALKKYKMPKRNVASKIKTMIESSGTITAPAGASTEEDQENRRPTRSSKPARKNGRWEDVMNKIAQGQAEQKLKPSRLKEVKSKVFASIGPAASTTTHQPERPKRSTSNMSGQALSLKPKSRRGRSRTSSSNLQQQQQKQQLQQQSGGVGSPASTPHSSMSDLSVSQKPNTGPVTRSSKKRDVGRSASPLSDGSTNSATSHVMTRASSHLLRPSIQKNGVSQVAEMKTPPVRKQPSRRNVSNAGQKPTPLRDHNRLAGGGTVVKSEPLAKLQTAATPRAPPQGTPVTTPVTTPNPEAFLPQLKHAVAGFDAFGALVQYLVHDLDAFSTEQLKKECNAMKTEWLRTKLDLEELQVSYQRVQDTIVDERLTHRKKLDDLSTGHQQALVAVESKGSQERTQLVERYEAQLADYDKRFQQEVKELRTHYEVEQARLDATHAEREAELLRDGQERLELARRDHEASLARLQDEHKHAEDDLRTKLGVLEAENATMKEQARKLMDSMQKDKDTKLQATAARCRELQDEVQSLQTVLELRHEELQELRRHSANLAREAEELPSALQRIAALQARVEDLQVQLQRKASFERQLSQEHRLLVESLHQEAKQKNRLSLHNEELQWKLKQNTEVVNVLAAMNGAAMSGSLQLPSSPACSSPATSRRSAHGSTQSLSETFSRTPPRTVCGGRPCELSTQILRAEAEDEATSPPSSPKIKGIVEKSDSVSWVLEIEETPEELVSRLMRRTGSFRGTTPPPASSPSPHARTLPPPKRQRCKAASLSLSSSTTSVSRQAQLMKSNGTTNGITVSSNSVRSRSRSVSADSMDGVDYMSWPTAISTPIHHNIHMQRCVGEGNGTAHEDLIVSLKNTGKSSLLKRCGNEVDVVLHDDELLRRDSLCHVSNKWNASVSECSNDDSPTKSSSSSASSSSSSSSTTSSDGSIRSSGGGGGGSSDREYRHRKKSTSKLLLDTTDTRRSLDLVEADVLPLPPLPGSNTATSSDLSLLAACAAAQPALMPKESAGEAMISEETSEDENDDHDNDVRSSSDERSCSEDEEESTSESSSGLGLQVGAGTIRGLQTSHEEGINDNSQRSNEDERGRGQQNRGTESSNQQYNLLMMSDSGSISTTTTTTMDLSWSEDMELMPSESEG